MKLGKTFYAKDRKAWRKWLEKNHAKAKEIWLIYYKQHMGKPRVPYAEAVEEALCFGWIDSTVKSINKDSFAQRFSPRKSKSAWSQPNIERMKRLKKQGLMAPAGLAAFQQGSPTSPRLRGVSELKITPDILKALKADKEVWKNFQKFPGSYKRVRIAYIESQRRHGREAFQRSLRNFIKKTKANKKFAFGGPQ